MPKSSKSTNKQKDNFAWKPIPGEMKSAVKKKKLQCITNGEKGK